MNYMPHEVPQTDLWGPVVGHLRSEATLESLAIAKDAVEPLWPFLAASDSRGDFEQRLALADGNIVSLLMAAQANNSFMVADPSEYCAKVAADFVERFVTEREPVLALYRAVAALDAVTASENTCAVCGGKITEATGIKGDKVYTEWTHAKVPSDRHMAMPFVSDSAARMSPSSQGHPKTAEWSPKFRITDSCPVCSCGINWVDPSDHSKGMKCSSCSWTDTPSSSKTAGDNWFGDFQIGDRIRGTSDGYTHDYEVVRIAPPGAAGTSYNDGPTYYAQIVGDDGNVIPNGYVATIWSKSMSNPTSKYTKVSSKTAAQTCPSCKQDTLNWVPVEGGGKDEDGEDKKAQYCSNCDYGVGDVEKHGARTAALHTCPSCNAMTQHRGNVCGECLKPNPSVSATTASKAAGFGDVSEKDHDAKVRAYYDAHPSEHHDKVKGSDFLDGPAKRPVDFTVAHAASLVNQMLGGRGNDFSISDAKNEDGEWTMSPEQIRSEMAYDPYEDEGDFYDDDHYASLRTAAAQPSEHTQRFVDGLNAKHGGDHPGDPWPGYNRYEATGGSKFDRVVLHHPGPDGTLPPYSGSAHAFVNRETGQVHKADGWKRPTRDARYPDVDSALNASDPFGRYLYAGRGGSKTSASPAGWSSTSGADSAEGWVMDNLGRRVRVDYTDGEQVWGKFEMDGSRGAWFHDDRGQGFPMGSFPMDYDQVRQIVPVAEMDPSGQDALFDKGPFNLTSSHRAVAAMLREAEKEPSWLKGHEFTNPLGYCKHCGMDKPEKGDWFPSCASVEMGFEATRHEAVNESAYGTDRYQHTDAPAKPEWINDAWDDKGPSAEDTRRGLVGGGEIENPFKDTLTTTRQSSRTAATIYGGGEIPDDLVAAAGKYWYGDNFRSGPGEETKYSSDGGSYTVKGVKISGGGEWGVIFTTEPNSWNPAPFSIEFYDGSGGGITPTPGGGWDFSGMGGPSHFALRRQAAFQHAPLDGGDPTGNNLQGTQQANGVDIDHPAVTSRPRTMPSNPTQHMVTVQQDVLPATQPLNPLGGVGDQGGLANPLMPTGEQRMAARRQRIATTAMRENPDLQPREAFALAEQVLATYPEMLEGN